MTFENYLTIRGILLDIALFYGVIHFYKQNKRHDYSLELTICITLFVVDTFFLGLNFVNLNTIQ